MCDLAQLSYSWGLRLRSLLVHDRRAQKSVADVGNCWHEEDLPTVGEAFERTSRAVGKGRIAEAEAELLSQREIVDHLAFGRSPDFTRIGRVGEVMLLAFSCRGG